MVFETVQVKNFDWKIPFGARAFQFPEGPEIYREDPGVSLKNPESVSATK